ncbi:hypothetical protein BH24ACT22_BH24ACT22_13580 [soil metagenome]
MQSYPKSELCILYDRRDLEARDRLEREKAAWGNRATVERIDDHHDVLIVRPGVREVVR